VANTPNLNLEEPAHGSANWDTPLNNNFSLIDAGVLLNAPLADQTIAGSHQLINQGTDQTGSALTSFDAHIQGTAVNPTSGNVSISGQSLGNSKIGLQGIAQGLGAGGILGLASDAQSTTTSAPNGGVFVGYIDTTGNNSGGATGTKAIAFDTPSGGTTVAFARGNQASAFNKGAGVVTLMVNFSAVGNGNDGGGTVTKNYAYDVDSTFVSSLIGATNAAFHSPTTGTGAANYVFYSEGGRFRIDNTPVPSTAASAGTAGEIAWDSGFIYVCVSTNTWKRVAIATW